MGFCSGLAATYKVRVPSDPTVDSIVATKDHDTDRINEKEPGHSRNRTWLCPFSGDRIDHGCSVARFVKNGSFFFSFMFVDAILTDQTAKCQVGHRWAKAMPGWESNPRPRRSRRRLRCQHRVPGNSLDPREGVEPSANGFRDRAPMPVQSAWEYAPGRNRTRISQLRCSG